MAVCGCAQSRIVFRGAVASACAVAAIAIAGSRDARAATAACNVTWTGGTANNLWTTPGNWSTGKVPGPTSDVCISPFVIVVGPKRATVHSLQVGEASSVDFGEQAGSAVTITAALQNHGNFLIDGTLSAGSIDNSGGINSYGQSTVVSKSFSSTGTVSALDGTLRLPGTLAQLQHGNLTAGAWEAYRASLVLPEDVTRISGGRVDVAGSTGSLTDAAGHNALASLGSIGAGAVLAVNGEDSIQIAGSLVSQGLVVIGEYNGIGTLTIGGTFTEGSGASTALFGGNLSARVVTISQGAELAGAGTIAAPVTNSGTFGAQNELSLTGDYTQTATGTLTNYIGATLSVAGNATLAGALNININHRCPPPVGFSFIPLTFKSRSGLFTSHTAGFSLQVAAHDIKATFEGAAAAAVVC